MLRWCQRFRSSVRYWMASMKWGGWMVALPARSALVKAGINHPCVIIWGFLNEAPTSEEYVRPFFEETVDTLRALDASRLISYASMFALTDTCYDLVDLVSLNLYPGWYGSEGEPNPLELIAPKFAECFAHLDAAGWSEKPVLISEIGAEAIYGQAPSVQ